MWLHVRIRLSFFPVKHVYPTGKEVEKWKSGKVEKWKKWKKWKSGKVAAVE